MNTADKVSVLLRGAFYLFGLYFLYSFLFTVLHNIFPQLDTSSYEQRFITEMLAENPLRAFFMIVVVAPVIEEMMFRSLLKPSHVELVLFIIIWPVFFLLRFVPIEANWILKLIFTAVFLFSVLYIAQQLIPKKCTRRVRLWLRKYEFIIWVLSSFLFGFIHITNYVDHFTLNLSLFLLILPRILAGFMVGWVKLKNSNLPWAMALHAINNGVAFFFIYLTS